MIRFSLLAACVILSACTTFKINDDSTTVEHEGGTEVGQDLANRACKRVGEQGAEILSTVNKNPDLPPGTGTQLTTFRCSAGAR